jgi:hypothetical protein
MQVRDVNIPRKSINTDRFTAGNLNPNIDIGNANINTGMAAGD